MRHHIGYIALSLLAAALAGCSSTDTGSTPGSSQGGDPLTGPLAVYQAKINALVGTVTYDATAKSVTVTLDSTDTLVVLSERAVDKVLLVNGVAVTDTDGNDVTVTKIQAISVTATAGGTETVLIDVRNGIFAKKSGTNSGITIDLGGDANDELAIQGAATADRMGCTYDTTNTVDQVGLSSVTAKDVTLTSAVKMITVDLGSGDDTFDQGTCNTKLKIYGGPGKDTIYASTETVDNPVTGFKADTFFGGADADTISYARRTTAVKLTPDGATNSGGQKTAALGDEGDKISEFETLTGGAGDDQFAAGQEAGITLYTYNGGAGDDTFKSVLNHPIVFNGGTGEDTVDYSTRSNAAITATMGDGKANDGEAGATSFDNIASDVEDYKASTQGDTVTGNSLNNKFYSGAGNDVFSGGAGDDTFVAAATDGNDVFFGGAGKDTVDYSARTGGAVCIDLNGVYTAASGNTPASWAGKKSGDCADITSVVLTTPSTFPMDADSEADHIANDVENAIGTDGDDLIVGNASDNVLNGGGGADRLIGGAGNDELDEPWTVDCSSVDVKVLCGGDPLDVFSCKKAAGTGTNYGFGSDTCWKVQTGSNAT